MSENRADPKWRHIQIIGLACWLIAAIFNQAINAGLVAALIVAGILLFVGAGWAQHHDSRKATL